MTGRWIRSLAPFPPSLTPSFLASSASLKSPRLLECAIQGRHDRQTARRERGRRRKRLWPLSPPSSPLLPPSIPPILPLGDVRCERAKSALVSLVVLNVLVVVLARQNDKVKGRRRRRRFGSRHQEAAVGAAAFVRPMPNAAQTPPVAAAANFAPRVTPLFVRDQFQRERSVPFSPVARSWADL